MPLPAYIFLDIQNYRFPGGLPAALLKTSIRTSFSDSGPSDRPTPCRAGTNYFIGVILVSSERCSYCSGTSRLLRGSPYLSVWIFMNFRRFMLLFLSPCEEGEGVIISRDAPPFTERPCSLFRNAHLYVLLPEKRPVLSGSDFLFSEPQPFVTAP